MSAANRGYQRKNYFINKPLQLRFMAYITGTLLTVAVILMASIYFGIWGGILDAFSNDKIRNDLLIATRLTEYEVARVTPEAPPPLALSFFKQSAKLSERQREIFKDILDETNRKMIPKLALVVLLIAWGSIFLSHKIAGPLYRFHVGLADIDKGNLKTRITLRKGDEGQFIADRFNQTVENLDFTFARLKNILAENETNHERMVMRLKEELSKIKTSTDR
jgi:methyl-accepting chemotaxis protein